MIVECIYIFDGVGGWGGMSTIVVNIYGGGGGVVFFVVLNCLLSC